MRQSKCCYQKKIKKLYWKTQIEDEIARLWKDMSEIEEWSKD